MSDWSSDVCSSDLRKLPHMHIDLGSEPPVDMSYTGSADLYLGDVSSQVAEYLYRPRPCVFLNAQGVDWQEDPNYRFWSLGPVIDDVQALAAGLETAFQTHADFEVGQRRYFDESFGVEPGVPTAARGADAIAEFLRRRSAALGRYSAGSTRTQWPSAGPAARTGDRKSDVLGKGGS